MLSKTLGAGGPFGNSNDVVVAPAGAGVFLNFAWLNFFPFPSLDGTERTERPLAFLCVGC